MAAKHNVFSDRIVNVLVTGNLVRLDFASLDQPPTKEGEKPTFEITHRITLPIEGFLQSLEMQQTIVQRLVADGRIKAAPAEDAKS